MPSNGDKNHETKDKPHWFEQKPKEVNRDTARKIGGLAVNGAQKDKGKK